MRALVVDLVCRKAEAAVDRAVGLAVRVSLAGEPRLARVPPFCASIDEAVLRDCERVRPRLRTRLASVFAARKRASLSFASSSFGLQSAPTLGCARVFPRRRAACSARPKRCAGCGRSRATRPGSCRTGTCAGWRSAPVSSARIPRGRLHCADGPAVTYPDGWSAYAWKGVLVPSWIIERPDLVTVRAIAAAHDPQIRRCMIDVLTPERFIAGGGAYRVAQDDTGVLWRQRWRWEAWAAVEVVNGTPEEDGTYKHYFLQVPANMRSAREAVAWTYGLTEQRYKPSVRT